MKTASGLRIGLSTALVLISIQSSVPAAAQVFRGPVSEGAAARAMLPLMSNTPLPLSLAGGLPGLPSTLIPAPSALISPSVAPALTAVPTLAAVPVSAALPSAVAVRRPVSAREAMRSFAAARPSDASAAAAADGVRFDGAAAGRAAAEPVESAHAPARPGLLRRAVTAPLRIPAVASIRENAAWVRGFWSGLRADGVDVRRELRTASAMALVIATVSLVPSWLYGQLAQHLHELQGLAASSAVAWYHNPVLQTFGGLSAGLIAAHALGAYLTKFQSQTMYALGNKLMKGVSDLYVAKVLSLDMRWQNGRNVGDVVSTATDAIYTLQSTASAMIVDLVRNGSVALIAGTVMTAVSWKLSLLTIPFLIFALSIPSSLYGQKVQDAYRTFFAMNKPRFASALQEIAVNILKVKASGLEERELEKMREYSRQTYIVGGGEIADVAAPQRALAGGLTDVARVLVMAAAVGAVAAGVMPLSAAVTYIFLSNYFRDAVQALSGLWVSLKSMRGAAARYDATMKQASEDLHLDGKILPPTATGRRIEMNDVKFRYSKDGAPVLKGVNLTIEPGQMVGFVGMTGGGKTTTAMTLLGLYPLESGMIEIDGVPLSELNLRAFRKEIGVSLQDSIPFAGSIFDNIAYLRPGATEREVWDAAKAAGLHDQITRFGADRPLDANGKGNVETAVIQSLSSGLEGYRERLRRVVDGVPTGPLDPAKGLKDNVVGASGASWEQFSEAVGGSLGDVARLGYLTRVGERGLNLSGGQKQRLMLAQIFIQPRNPFGVMVYDEPTSALDGRTQSLIEDQIAARRGKSTQIVIAHRLSNVQRADKIVVFADGQVAEQGTHDELMAKRGVYAKMWDAQRLMDAATQQTSDAAR